MPEIVVDTNVLLVAEGAHADVSDECRLACTGRLLQIARSATVVIDDEFRVLAEYQRKLDARRGKGPGSAFLKWVLQNQANQRRVARVRLTESSEDRFVEFPVPELEARFDAPDRKFPAIANAHPAKPPILQAVDSKWLHWWPELAASGISVEFVCPQDILRFFQTKFPEDEVPDLP